MKAVSFGLFMMTGAIVIGLYVVAPLAAGLRPLVGSLLPALGLALLIVIGCAARIVSILRRAAPFVTDSAGLLEMPLLNPALPSSGEVIVAERRLVIPGQRTLATPNDAARQPG